jgi:hypothetical protein
VRADPGLPEIGFFMSAQTRVNSDCDAGDRAGFLFEGVVAVARMKRSGMRADSPGFRFRSIRATGAYRRFCVSRLYFQAGPRRSRPSRQRATIVP